MALTLELFASESHCEQDTTVSRRGDAEMQGFSTKLGPLMTKTCKKGEENATGIRYYSRTACEVLKPGPLSTIV